MLDSLHYSSYLEMVIAFIHCIGIRTDVHQNFRHTYQSKRHIHHRVCCRQYTAFTTGRSTLSLTHIGAPNCSTSGYCGKRSRGVFARTFPPRLALGSGFGGRGGGSSGQKLTCSEENPEGGGSGDSILTCTSLISRRRDFGRREGTRLEGNPIYSLKRLFSSIRISHVLLALNVGVFALQTLMGPNVLMRGAKVNSAITAGQYYRLFSPMFLHASVSHLLVNSFSLHSTGPSVESWFGKPRFLSLYIASGVSGNVLSYFCSPTPAVGASGAIFGLVGASLVVLGRHRQILGPRARKGLRSLAYVVIMNFGIGLTPGSRVDNFGHLGGFLGGIAFSYLLGPRLTVQKTNTGRKVLRDIPILRQAVSEMEGRLKELQGLIRRR